MATDAASGRPAGRFPDRVLILMWITAVVGVALVISWAVASDSEPLWLAYVRLWLSFPSSYIAYVLLGFVIGIPWAISLLPAGLCFAQYGLVFMLLKRWRERRRR